MEDKIKRVIEEFKNITAKPCYEILLDEAMPANILDNKLGGRAYIPKNEGYPKNKDGTPLALLLQINLKDIDLEGYPKNGILEIFLDANLTYPCRFALKYFQEGLDYIADFPKIDYTNFVLPKEYKIKCEKSICYMPLSDYRFFDTVCMAIYNTYGVQIQEQNELDYFFENRKWLDIFSKELVQPQIVIGGYADFTQTDPRCKKNSPDLSECLFKIDSYGEYDMINIGDDGILSALISKSDLENKKFNNAVIDWDCC